MRTVLYSMRTVMIVIHCWEEISKTVMETVFWLMKIAMTWTFPLQMLVKLGEVSHVQVLIV